MQFGGRTLFDDVSFMIGPHDRIGLVGSNGTGKSTLLKIIGGIHQAERGTIGKAHYVTVGYLPQDGVIASGLTLYKEVETAFEDILLVQQELDEAHQRMASFDPASSEYQETLEIYGELQHKLEDLDAFRMKSKIERVLMGLGFSIPDLERQTEEFSGGWQMRIALAKLLLKEPSVLLLDEPTNHLDIESLQWLEEYLHNYNGAIILVSHDRAFLDSLTTTTFTLSSGKMEMYSGNYSFFERERLVRKEQQVNAFKNQQKQLKHTQEFIERFRYKATKARQVQSRIKALEKVDMIEIENDEEGIHFHFPQPQQSGKMVMELKNVSKSYGSKKVFEGLNYILERGDRIAVVGVNGAGKSTFSRIVAGVEPMTAGTRTVGYNVIPAYFAQHQAEELDLTKDALQIVDEVATGEIRKKLRTILGSFLFHGDDVFKKVGVLSGGEKSRLALAKMLLQPANFLIMDEPTNHLDMRSKTVLQESLLEYDGTYVIVSHDRAFLDPLVNKVLEINTTGIRTFLGNVSDYLEKKKSERETKPIPVGGKSNLSDKERKRMEADLRRERYNLLKPYKDQFEKVEKEIAKMESRKKQIEEMMLDAEFYKHDADAKKTAHEYTDLKKNLENAYFRWNELTEKMAGVEKGIIDGR